MDILLGAPQYIGVGCTNRAMRCPFCGSREDRVLDSRESQEGDAIRRRRECKNCGRRFTTLEQTVEQHLFVVKRDGRREPFARSKVLDGMRVACKGRPVSAETLEAMAADVERMLYNRLDREVPSTVIGEMVMEKLQALDHVAYVRFASVYRQFEDASQFRDIVRRLQRKAR